MPTAGYDGPLAEGEAFGTGAYEIVFHAGEYFRDRGVDLPNPPFIDLVPIRFGIASPDEHYPRAAIGFALWLFHLPRELRR